MTKAEISSDKAREEAVTAKEEAVKLRGELEATKTQNAELLAALRVCSRFTWVARGRRRPSPPRFRNFA